MLTACESMISGIERQTTLQELFEEQVAQQPDSVAIVCEGIQITYRELNQRANQLAYYLQKEGIYPEKFVGICLERSSNVIVGILGILKAGGVYVPIDPAYPKERINYILEDAQASILLTQKDMDNEPELSKVHPIYLDGDWNEISKESNENPKVNVLSGNAAYVIYTSGSTGKPKGVVISHQNVVRLFDSTQGWFQFNNNDVWCISFLCI